MSSSKLFQPGKLISIPDVNFKMSGKFRAPQGHKEMGAGKSYIPPLTLKTSMTAPKKAMTFAATQQASALPASFSWNDNNSVAQYKGKEYVGIIQQPSNQLTCGDCWAFSTSTALSDRFAIAQKAGNPMLGPSYLVSCSVSGNCDQNALAGCNGGMIDTALNNMSTPIGGVPSNCWNYEWCVSGCDSQGDGDYNNSKVPEFDSNKHKCVSEKKTTPKLYKVKPNSVQALINASQIKNSIFQKGPIPTGFIVYTDFFMGTAPSSQGGDNWAATSGIYVHLEIDSTGATPKGDVPPYKYGSADDMNQQAGAHAVVIVGWGTQTVPNFLPKSLPKQKTINLPYWIVRNSWGKTWGDNGFFKIAMTNPDLYINTTVFLDSGAQGGAGGPIDFEPELSNAPAPLPLNNPSSPKSILGNISTNKMLIIAVIIIAILVLLYIKRYRK